MEEAARCGERMIDPQIIVEQPIEQRVEDRGPGGSVAERCRQMLDGAVIEFRNLLDDRAIASTTGRSAADRLTSGSDNAFPDWS